MTKPTRTASTALRTALFAALTLSATFACDTSASEQARGEQHAAASEVDVEPEANEISPAPSVDAALEQAAPAEPAPSFEAPAETDAVLASATPTTLEIAQPKAVPATGDRGALRDPSLLPANTPEAHLAAFAALPVGKRDGAPVGGVGATGLHLDSLDLGTGYAKGQCEGSTRVFDAGADERVSVCFRVIHPREAETVTVEWARDGVMRHSIEVGVRPTHSYRTRAWMPVTEGRAGNWTATVKSEDGSVLGSANFEIVR